ncbi:MAG: ECF transporter S component [Lachnoclostridium sp.]|nr:ECF transporter S component [Lachnospira sp.]MCM1249320.1 ECF transporter S component [Lachnoclostridium sp.]MCM1535623.1 ECF transporter S component [Clostridium sp.]
MDTKKSPVYNLTLAAMFLALCMALPWLTGQIPQIGSMLLPMHIPVFLCGLICGWQYGLAVGFVAPVLRYFLFGMPPIFPTGIAMAFELATYGLTIGLLYSRSKWKCVIALYRSMILSMLAGRVVWGIVEIVLLGIRGNVFTWQMFLAGAFVNAIPGIILQLIFIPGVMVALNRAGLVRIFHQKESAQPQKKSVPF